MSDYPLFELEGLRFGGDEPIQVSSFDPGAPEMRTQEQEREVGDGIWVGRDHIAPPTWSFDLFTDVHDWAEAMGLNAAMTARWLDPELRNRPGVAVPLRYYMAGRWRRVYGRPRRFSGADGGALTRLGRGEMNADFKLVHHLTYDDVEQSISVGMIPPSTGGFIFPLTFPMTTVRRGVGERGGQFRVGGNAPAWPVVTIEGPISDAVVHVGSWSMRTVGAVGEGRSITIDAAPWAQTITRDDGASVAGMLHPTVAMSGLSLPPGDYELRLEGRSTTGTARATIAWRDAYYGL